MGDFIVFDDGLLMIIKTSNGKYHWGVTDGDREYAYGSTHTYDQAFRNARAFIRSHQNLVYS